MDARTDEVRVGPWRRRSRRSVYENPWLEVFHDEVLRPDGSPGIYGVVHLRNAAVGVVPLDDAGRVLLVGQHRYTLDAYSWEIPEGGVPAGEDRLEGAKRELREETGFEASEDIEVRWVALDEAIAMIDRGEITDLMSVGGLIRVALERGRHSP